MRKLIIVLSVCLLSVLTQAQDSYFGVSSKAAFFSQLGFENTSTTNITFGAHYGGQLVDDLDLRVGAELIVAGWPGLSFNLASFYRIELAELSSAYIGLGVDAGLGLSADTAAPLAGGHGVLGFEFSVEGLGFFVELQPFYYALDLAGLAVKAGANLYF